MSEELIFSTDSALVSNLDRLSREESIIGEQRFLELSDIATSLARVSAELGRDGLGIYDILSAVSDGISFGEYPVSDLTDSSYSATASRAFSSLARLDKEILADLYTTALEKSYKKISETDFLPGSKPKEIFAYVRNSLSDEAFDVFSQEFDDPKVKYYSSMRECARAVVDGEVGYCLLPFEEKGGVRLSSVSELIFRNDFKIDTVTPVFGQDGNADVKYALVSKSFSVPKRNDGDDRYLEIRIGATDDFVTADLFSAVNYFGMSVYRVNTFTFDTEGESETYFSIVIRDGECDFTALLVYLTLFIGDFVPVGIYKNLE